jgi:hypothetical protein
MLQAEQLAFNALMLIVLSAVVVSVLIMTRTSR